jgi:hypothetical protein
MDATDVATPVIVVGKAYMSDVSFSLFRRFRGFFWGGR